jgi:PAS domain S-box-containing protein
MQSRKQYIFLSFRDDQMPEQIRSLTDLADVFLLVSKKNINEGFRQQLVNTSSLWVMDQKIFEELLHDNNLQLENLAELIVMCREDLSPAINRLDFPENISFISWTVPIPLLRLQLKQGLKKALKRTAEVLEHERYESLFVNNAQPHLILDPLTGNIIEANYASAGLFGVEYHDMAGKNIDEVHPSSYAVLEAYLNKIFEGEKLNVNIRFISKEKQSRELQYRLNLVSLYDKKCAFVRIDDITDKDEAYAMYYHQAEMLKNTIESIDDLIFSLNRKGDFIEYYQPTGGTHFASSNDGFIGKNIFDVGFPEVVALKYMEAVEIVMNEDRPEQIDYYLEAFGTQLWYNARVSPRKNIYGIIDGVTVLCRDITKQKKTEETLKKARDFYMTLLADFPSMIWKTDRIKRPDYFNKTWLEFTGKTFESEIQTEWIDKIHPNDLKSFLEVLIQAYKNKQPFQIEHRLKHRSGDFKWVINAGSPFYNITGQFEGYIGSCYDITGRRKAEEMMYLQKSAMESALEGILIIQDDHRNYPVIYANKELAKLTSSAESDIIGRSFVDILGCPLSEDFSIDLLKALKNRSSYRGEYFCHDYSDGISQQWFLLDLAPVKDKIDNVNHFVAVISDITKSKTVEKILREKNKQLQKTNAELDSFVYSTSHELRSPLMSVLGLLNLLETDIDHQDQKTFLSMIRESISRLDKIIHDIIDYSRNSRLDLENEHINFNEMIEWVIQNHKYYDNFSKVRFSVHVKESGSFLSDKRRIQVILNNLVSNSLRFHNYNQPDPYIDIEVDISSANALITVKDNGTGIHNDHISRIYEMFYRGTERSRGSGIGLYIVKEIVDKLNGTIEVESSLQSGTVFSVDLPNFINKNFKSASMVDNRRLKPN